MAARRGHGSVKVPGVKLRPAPAKIKQDADDADDTAPDAPDAPPADNKLLRAPFSDVYLSATGIGNKRELFKLASDLGATCISAFTNHTTHLIAEEPGSAKYICALERGIPIVTSEWVNQAHSQWLIGGDVNVNELDATHRLPTFCNRVKICLTEFEDIDMRVRIHKLVEKHGGRYSKGFDATVTHLICGQSNVSSKVRIVWDEWLWDCIEFNGMWNTDGYASDKERPQRKIKSAIPKSPPPKANIPLPPSFRNELLMGPEQSTEVAVPRRIARVSSQIWGTILKSQAAKASAEPQEPSPTVASVDVSHGTVISRVSSAKAAALHRAPETNQPARLPRQPFSRVSSAVAGPSRLLPERTASIGTVTSATSNRIFAGTRVYAWGAARCNELRKPLTDKGAVWLAEDDDIASADFVLVRLAESAKLWQKNRSEQVRSRMRTECWVEKCLHDERVCAADEHDTFTPLQVNVPLAGAAGLNICWSGLNQAEIVWVRRLIKTLGAEPNPNFTTACSVLICESGEGLKSDHARKRGVPIVPIQWLFDAASSGVMEPPLSASTQCDPPDTEASMETQLQTYGETMTDITNDTGSRGQSGQFSSLPFDSIDSQQQRSYSEPSLMFGNPKLLIMPKTASASAVQTPFDESIPISPAGSFAQFSPDGLGLGKKRTRSDEPVSAGPKASKKARPMGRGGVALERESSLTAVGLSTPERAAAADAAARRQDDEDTTHADNDVDYVYKDAVEEAAQRKLLSGVIDRPDFGQTAKKATRGTKDKQATKKRRASGV
ncbi:hypothetical protein BKA62DRAFT_824589 [Auriculariales sp. MPI-PUGE-AT-0066]|nr:hypothetical protein BKA62DRAFT_824589 [Auriculariales sp. MPI-PUGE-AT-0066]